MPSKASAKEGLYGTLVRGDRRVRAVLGPRKGSGHRLPVVFVAEAVPVAFMAGVEVEVGVIIANHGSE